MSLRPDMQPGGRPPQTLLPPELPLAAPPEPLFLALRDYWHGLRAGALIPRRNQIRFSSVEPVLLDITIFEHHGPADIRYWFVGPNRVDPDRPEPMGVNLLTLFKPAFQGPFGHHIDEMLHHPAGLWVELADGKRTLSSLVLPLGGVDSRPHYTITVNDFHGPQGWYQDVERFVGSVTAIQLVPIDIGAGVPFAPQLLLG